MKRIQKKLLAPVIQEVYLKEGNAKLCLSEVRDQDTLSPASNFPCKTCAKKGKKHEGIQKSAEPLDIQNFRKRYPLHSNNHTLIRHIVLSKWRASRRMTSEKQS